VKKKNRNEEKVPRLDLALGLSFMKGQNPLFPTWNLISVDFFLYIYYNINKEIKNESRKENRNIQRRFQEVSDA